MSLVPVAIFFAFCIILFVVFKAFNMEALAMGGFVALLIGGIFCKSYTKFWDSAIRGISSISSVSVIVIFFVIGMFSALMKESGLSGGFVWLANSVGIQGGLFVAFVFFATCIVSTATGSSIGTMFTAFPIFYPAGIILGGSPMFLAGAIVSGAIFGDNLAPISDTTIASASTQQFRDGRPADVGGCVKTRFKYSIVAGSIALVLFAILGGIGGTTALQPALTLGCGAVGGSATSENVGPMHLLNLRYVAYGLKELDEIRASVPDCSDGVCRTAPSLENIDVDDIVRQIIGKLQKL